MIPQLQKILEADDAQLEELVKIASQKAGPPNMQQFMSMMAPQPQEQQGAQGLAGLLAQQAPQVPAVNTQVAAQPVPRGLAALLQGGGRV